MNKKKLIKKLNNDNRKLNELHKSWKEYALVQIIAGILLVIALIIIIYFNN